MAPLGVEVMIWVVYALGFNLLLGYGGLPSLGHASYLGVAAYVLPPLLTAFGLAYLFGILGYLRDRIRWWDLAAAAAGLASIAYLMPRAPRALVELGAPDMVPSGTTEIVVALRREDLAWVTEMLRGQGLAERVRLVAGGDRTSEPP